MLPSCAPVCSGRLIAVAWSEVLRAHEVRMAWCWCCGQRSPHAPRGRVAGEVRAREAGSRRERAQVQGLTLSRSRRCSWWGEAREAEVKPRCSSRDRVESRRAKCVALSVPLRATRAWHTLKVACTLPARFHGPQPPNASRLLLLRFVFFRFAPSLPRDCCSSSPPRSLLGLQYLVPCAFRRASSS